MYNREHHGEVSALSHHGDVHILPRAEYEALLGPVIAGNQIERQAGRVLLAEGEATGHHHVIEDDGAELYEVAANDNQIGVVGLLKVTDKVTLRHQEHPEIGIPPGEYVVWLPREYDDENEWRRVAD